MAYYQKLERPVANESEAVQLRFGLTLQQIMDVVSGIYKFLMNQQISTYSAAIACYKIQIFSNVQSQ